MRKLAFLLIVALVGMLAACGALADIPVANEKELSAAYTYILDGVEYQLPTPVSELMANGWALTGEDSDTLAARTYTIYTDLEKDGAVLDVYTLNPTQEELPLESCYIVRIVADARVADIADKMAGAAKLALPNGLAVGKTVADMKQTYGVELKKIENNDESTMEDYWTGEESWHGKGYYLLKDGKYFLNAGSIGSDGYDDFIYDTLTFYYKVVDKENSLVLNNNTAQQGENSLTIVFDAPLNDDQGTINMIEMNLMMGPAE